LGQYGGGSHGAAAASKKVQLPESSNDQAANKG